MPSKRFLSTAAPLAILAVAGMGLATAQSSSPFASKKRAQAWEQPAQAWEQPAQSAPTYRQPAAPAAAAPQYSAPSYSTPSYSAPVYSAPSYSSHTSQAAANPDAPIATRPAAPAYRTASTATPPKTYGGRPAAPAQPSYAPSYGASNLAGRPAAQLPATSRPAATRPTSGPDYGYTYTPPQPRYAQAPDLGTSAPRGASVPPQPSPQSAPRSSGSPYAPRSGQRPQAWETPQQPAQPPAYNPGQYAPNTPAPAPQAPTYQNQPYPANSQYPNYQSSTPPQGGAPYSGGPFTPPPQQKRSWKDKLGLGNIATVLRGAFTGGVAATDRDQPEPNDITNTFVGPDDGWSEDFIGDAELEVEVSAITKGGLEYGVTLGGSAQYDPYRRGFGGRVPDCPPTVVGCSGGNLVFIAGEEAGLRGHTSGFYSTGEDITKDVQAAIESAHIFLRSAYGDVTVGRDDGAAYLFSLGAPTLLAVGASNSPVDYTGFDSVKTVNDASGFSEKITYTSPRLLGDQIGVGIQIGASYALDADVCGVDYCNGRTIDGVIQPEIEDVFEVGLALDRQFENGLGVELTGTYANGSETSGFAGLDDLESFGAGLEFTYSDWTLGGSFLQSNNGLLDGDYTAYDGGITWKPGALGFTLGYGHAEDDNLGLSSDQGTFGVTYDFNKFTLGTGVQYVDREVNGLDAAGALTTLDQKATSIFVQGGFKF